MRRGRPDDEFPDEEWYWAHDAVDAALLAAKSLWRLGELAYGVNRVEVRNDGPRCGDQWDWIAIDVEVSEGEDDVDDPEFTARAPRRTRC